MTLANFRDHWESMDVLQAEHQLFAASASAFPHMKERARDQHHSEMVRRATRRQRATNQPGPFRINGQPVSTAGARRAFGDNLGRGFADE